MVCRFEKFMKTNHKTKARSAEGLGLNRFEHEVIQAIESTGLFWWLTKKERARKNQEIVFPPPLTVEIESAFKKRNKLTPALLKSVTPAETTVLFADLPKLED